MLRSGHLQTMIGSRGREYWVRQRARPVLAAARPELLSVNNGIRLQAWLSQQQRPAPGVILIHGWLGHADSTYVLSAAAELWRAGFNVYRLNLRDHGNTAHLNEEMFHSARIDEVVNAINRIVTDHATGPIGLAGYSLGGNFALRTAGALDIETLAICPVIDPSATMTRIDSGLAVYRLFFLRKWYRALLQKESAFPSRYRFTEARRLKSVTELTELFVTDHTEFSSTEAYLNAYSLLGDALRQTEATILYAQDDPVIPAGAFDELPTHLNMTRSLYGGHCAFVEHPAAPTWSDHFLVEHFKQRLAG